MRTFPKRLTIGGTDDITAIVRGRCVVSGSIIGRVLHELVLYKEEVHCIVADILVLTIAGIGLKADHDVTSFRVQTTIELKHGPDVLALAIGQAGTLIVIHKVR